MGSSGDSGSSAGLMALMNQATPMPGLPVAGSANATGDPYEYGKFQNFLPDAKASGPNDNATGLRPEMFEYKKPSNPRDQLAQAMAPASPPAAAPANNPQWAAMRAQMSPQDIAMFQTQVSPAEFAAFMGATGGGGGGGSIGTMGLGGGGGGGGGSNVLDTWTNRS